MDRREFLSAAAFAALAPELLRAQDGQPQAPARGRGQGGRGQGGRGGGRGQAAPEVPPDPAVVARAHGTWCMYSRHLQWVSTAAEAASDPFGVGVKIGERANEIGVGAVNLTVRGGGHVEPANQARCLPEMLKGIRSTGIVCDTMTPSISPSSNPDDTGWLTTQRVDETLALASANGIRRYRIGGGGGYPPHSYGAAITRYLDGWRVNMERLAAVNQKYNTQAIFHTQGSMGMALWDLMYVWRNIDPQYVGFNYCVGHVARNNSAMGETSMFANNLRYIFPYLACIALQDFAWRINPDGTYSASVPPSGNGMVDWVLFFKILRNGGYNGLFDTQQEYQTRGADGSMVSMNAAWFADHDVFTSGRMTPAIAVAAMKKDMDYYKSQAKEAGWTDAQLTP